MTNLKQNRWVKVHKPGQANYIEKENVMNITVGENRCQAEVLYTVRSYKKAAGWLLRYLECANANEICTQIASGITEAANEAEREAPEITVTGECWSLTIEKMSTNEFKVCLTWKITEQNTEQVEPEPIVKKTRRGRKKKAESEIAAVAAAV